LSAFNSHKVFTNVHHEALAQCKLNIQSLTEAVFNIRSTNETITSYQYEILRTVAMFNLSQHFKRKPLHCSVPYLHEDQKLHLVMYGQVLY